MRQLDARVVRHDVDAPEAIDHAFDAARNRGAVADVDREREHVLPHFASNRLDVLLRPRRDDDRGTLLGEARADGAADPRPPARHERDLALEPPAHRYPGTTQNAAVDRSAP